TDGRRKASSTDPSTWATFEDVLTAYCKGRWDGIGFAHVPDDNLTGLDWDKCRDPATGEISPNVLGEVVSLSTYSELSPTNGVRAYAHGRKPGRKCKSKDGKLEAYDGLTIDGTPGGRYLTITGHRLPDTPATIEPRQEQIDALYRKRIDPSQPTNGKHS